MKAIVGDLWAVEADFRGIPTNPDVDSDLLAIMGTGVALQAKTRFPDVAKVLGKFIISFGSRVQPLHLAGLFAFPVKERWFKRASKATIARSVKELTKLAKENSDKTFALPLVGTGAGDLRPEEVWPLLKGLPDNVIVVAQKPELLPAEI